MLDSGRDVRLLTGGVLSPPPSRPEIVDSVRDIRLSGDRACPHRRVTRRCWILGGISVGQPSEPCPQCGVTRKCYWPRGMSVDELTEICLHRRVTRRWCRPGRTPWTGTAPASARSASSAAHRTFTRCVSLPRTGVRTPPWTSIHRGKSTLWLICFINLLQCSLSDTFTYELCHDFFCVTFATFNYNRSWSGRSRSSTVARTPFCTPAVSTPMLAYLRSC